MESLVAPLSAEDYIISEKSTFFSVKDNGKLIFDDSKFFEFLEKSGFGIVQKAETIELVKIENNIVSKVISTDIKRLTIDYLTDNEYEKALNYVLRNTSIFSSRYLDGLKLVSPKIIRDTEKSSFLPYRNGLVEITANDIKDPIPYEKLEYQVWSHNIIDREFRNGNDLITNRPVFMDFLIKLANNDQVRFNYLITIIGYCLHNYRSNATTRAIIINDETVSENPEGGSGKTLFALALRELRNLVIKDGKSFSPKKSFGWSDIDETVDLVLIDETSKDFSFEDLFSVISLGIPVERKNQDGYFLPIEKSPLFIITSNNIVAGYSGSFKRRQYNVDIYQYFNAQWTPKDEFGHLFFSDWDEEEWAKFDLFMTNCIQIYLANGVIEPQEIDQKKKDSIRATNSIFVEWLEEIISELNVFNSTTILHTRFLEETGQLKRDISSKKFINFLKKYCEIYHYSYFEERTSILRGFKIVFN
jgi:hypothetical protein